MHNVSLLLDEKGGVSVKNVLYIHTHDSGRILSPYGYKVPTPNMEEFAKESVLFRNAYCAGPTIKVVCWGLPREAFLWIIQNIWYSI